MEARPLGKKLALDSNLLFALAEEEDWAHTFQESFQARGYSFFAPPTVVQEIAHAAFEKSGKVSQSALKALRALRGWGVTPYDLKSVGHGISERVARKILGARLLPEPEFNDALILAETALAEIPLLVSADQHLHGIDSDALNICLAASDLPLVRVAHPKRLLDALGIPFRWGPSSF
jgi:predicted nucleic acid-binding protein